MAKMIVQKDFYQVYCFREFPVAFTNLLIISKLKELEKLGPKMKGIGEDLSQRGYHYFDRSWKCRNR
jgi:hypothetical protein